MFSFASFPRVKKRKAITKATSSRPTRIRKLTGANPFRFKLYKAVQPKQSLIKLNYSVLTFNTSTSSAAPTQHAFRASLFDPDLTGIGHQPMGRDQLAELYKRYQIMAMQYRVTFINNDTANKLEFNVHNFHDSVVALADTDQMTELGNHKATHVGLSGGGQEIKSRVGYIDLARLSGQPRHVYMSNYRYQASIGVSPAEDMGFVVAYQTLGTPASTVFNLQYRVEIKYYVRFLEKKISLAKS